MRQILPALACGILFGFGLGFSGMVDPARVRGFLDVAGAWDPTLAFVMGGALAVSALAYPFILRRQRPLLEARFFLPTLLDVDAKLVGGAILFGIGWGIGGLCPGPGLAALALAPGVAIPFVVAMGAGMLLQARIAGERP